MVEATRSDIRREVRFRGRVQGVGFRYQTREIAERFPVVGFVQNLIAGDVLLVAEGTAPELDGFIAAVAKELDRYIVGYDVVEGPATGEFSDFAIRL